MFSNYTSEYKSEPSITLSNRIDDSTLTAKQRERSRLPDYRNQGIPSPRAVSRGGVPSSSAWRQQEWALLSDRRDTVSCLPSQWVHYTYTPRPYYSSTRLDLDAAWRQQEWALLSDRRGTVSCLPSQRVHYTYTPRLYYSSTR